MQKLSHSFDNFTIAMTFCQVCTKILRGKLKIFLDKCYRRCILLSMLRTETTLKPVEDRMNQLKCRKVGGRGIVHQHGRMTRGRIDWMSKKKVWRVIKYVGLKDVKIGDYPDQESATKKM